MRGDAASTDYYLADWRKGEPVECSDELEEEAQKLAAQLEQDYPSSRVKELVENGGFAA